MRKLFARDFMVIFIIMAVFYLQHLLSFRLGINFEEGRDGNAYYLAMQGLKPYRDFEWVYGPFSFLIYPSIMKLFGVNLLVLRISYIVFASLVIPLAYFLSRQIMPPTWSGIAAFLAIIFFDVPYYTFNHIFAVLGELGCLLVIARAIKTNKLETDIVYAGFFAAVAMLTKPFPWGASLFFSVFLFMMILKKIRPSLRITSTLGLFTGTVILAVFLFSHFYLGSAVKSFFMKNTPFSPNPGRAIYYNIDKMNFLLPITIFYNKFLNICAIGKIFLFSSKIHIKRILVDGFDSFIFLLPFFIPALIFIFYIKSNKIRTDIRNIFISNMPIILLLVIFSVFIWADILIVGHQMGRAFTIQATFILLTLSFYLLVNSVSENKKIFSYFIIGVFIFCLSSLHFLRYPWSRAKKFKEPLNLERARGVLVTPAEKKVYESLADYLSTHLNKDEAIAVLGYNPQFSFLVKQKNIFDYEETIFLRLGHQINLSAKDKGSLPKLRLIENEIMAVMNSKKPKILLDAVYSSNRPSYNNWVADHILKNYILTKTFGPFEIHEDSMQEAYLYLYSFKEK